MKPSLTRPRRGVGDSRKGDGDPLLPPGKRPSTKDIRQSWGLRLLPMAMEGSRETGVGGQDGLSELVLPVCLAQCSS